MRAIAKKPLSKDTATRKRSGIKQTSAPKTTTMPISSTGYTFIQPKLICPCDGGCPSCSPVVQSKLKVGAIRDKYEQKADRVADEVMRVPEPQVQRQAGNEEEKELIQARSIADQITPLVQRQVEEEEEEEELLQTKPVAEQPIPLAQQQVESEEKAFGDDTFHSIAGQRGTGGQSLDTETRLQMESIFKRDFSNVRIHTDARAQDLANSLNARAFTYKDDVWFGKNEKPDDRRLLSHELTHVVQQSSSSSRGDKSAIPTSGSSSEIEAHHASSEVDNGTATRVRVAQSVHQGVNRWAILGSWRWPHPIHGEARMQEVAIRAGTTAEWRSVLRSMDTEREFRDYLEGFLLAALDELPRGAPRAPRITAGGTAPGTPGAGGGVSYGGQYYRAQITRPSDDQIRTLLRALYTLGGGLDLPDWGFIERTPSLDQYYMPLLHRFVGRYQNLIIAEMSEVWRGGTMEAERIGAVASQGGAGMRLQMMQNAAAAALAAVDTRAAARNEVQERYAMNIIANSGRIIRVVVETARLEMQMRESVANTIFDVVWAAVPGGQTAGVRVLNAAAKEVLKTGMRSMIRAAYEENLTTRRDRIEEQYQRNLSLLVAGGHITSEISERCYSTFISTFR